MEVHRPSHRHYMLPHVPVLCTNLHSLVMAKLPASFINVVLIMVIYVWYDTMATQCSVSAVSLSLPLHCFD